MNENDEDDHNYAYCGIKDLIRLQREVNMRYSKILDKMEEEYERTTKENIARDHL